MQLFTESGVCSLSCLPSAPLHQSLVSSSFAYPRACNVDRALSFLPLSMEYCQRCFRSGEGDYPSLRISRVTDGVKQTVDFREDTLRDSWRAPVFLRQLWFSLVFLTISTSGSVQPLLTLVIEESTWPLPLCLSPFFSLLPALFGWVASSLWHGQQEPIACC